MATLPDKTVYDSDVGDQLDETARAWVERPVLILLEGTCVNRRYRMDKPTFTIGRDLTNDIVLRDTRSSRRHTKISYRNFDTPDQPPDVELHDLDSTNGTFVNGVRVQKHLLRDRDKILIGSTVFGFFLRDEAELEADQQLFHMASNDALTGLRNRGVLNMELDKEFDRARRYGRALSLVMLDIDHFKRFNDSYGHLMGDKVLQELGRLIRGNIRLNDCGARYGGEEFAIILPETAIEGALIQGERLRAAVQQLRIPHDETNISITISMGIAQCEIGLTRVDQLIKAADMALYQAKADGRNCIRLCIGGNVSSPASTMRYPSPASDRTSGLPAAEAVSG